nr:creatininase family protein [Fredinandcohnia onubensis]
MICLKSYVYSDYTSYELKEIIEKDNPIVIIPVGATEQHGPHLPLNTDADLGNHIALSMAQNCKERVLVLPPVWAGYSPHHMDFCGTITLKQSTLFHVVCDIIESLLEHDIKRIVLMNSHGGNQSLLKTVADEMSSKHSMPILYFTYWHLLSDHIKDIRQSPLNGMAHACELETSLKYFFHQDKVDVRESLIEDVMLPVIPFQNVDMFAPNKINIYKKFKDLTPTGQIGAPSMATKETGERLMKSLIHEFNSLVKEFSYFNE